MRTNHILVIAATVGGATISQEALANETGLRHAAERAVCHYVLDEHVDMNGHDFNVKRATVVHRDARNPSSATGSVNGQLSHRLRARSDDQIYYTIPYDEKGVPKDAKVEIDRGGVAAIFHDLAGLFAPLKDVLKIGDISLDPGKIYEAYGNASTAISKRVEGRGWEAQAAGIISLIGFTAAQRSLFCYPDGTLVREKSRPEVYLMQGGAKFWIPGGPSMVALGLDAAKVRLIYDGAAAQLADIPRDGALLKEHSFEHIWAIKNGIRYHVPDHAAFNAAGYRWENVRTVPDGALKIPVGPWTGTP